MNWLSANLVATTSEATVAPAAAATSTFQLKATTPGNFHLPLRPVIDGTTWMEDEDVYIVVSVVP